MAHITAPSTRSTRPASAASFGLFTTLARALAVRRQRQQLRRLPAHLRRDLGLSEADIAAELARPIWDAPASWRL